MVTNDVNPSEAVGGSANLDDEMLAELIKMNQMMMKKEQRDIQAKRSSAVAGEGREKDRLTKQKEKRDAITKKKQDKYLTDKGKKEEKQVKQREQAHEKKVNRMTATASSVGASAAYGAISTGITYMDYTKTRLEKQASAIETGGQVAGSAIGAIAGSMVAPGIGTAIGAGVGGTIGKMGGQMLNMSDKKERTAQTSALQELTTAYKGFYEAGIVDPDQIDEWVRQEAEIIVPAKLKGEEGAGRIANIVSYVHTGKEINDINDLAEKFPSVYGINNSLKG